MKTPYGGEDGDDVDLSGRCALTHGNNEVPRLLGRIEATLQDMRRDIQEGVDAQKLIGTRLESHDTRIGRLEESERNRVRINRLISIVALALLVPALGWANHVYTWFSEVSAICFPKSK
jgi:hypothetical protein